MKRITTNVNHCIRIINKLNSSDSLAHPHIFTHYEMIYLLYSVCTQQEGGRPDASATAYTYHSIRPELIWSWRKDTFVIESPAGHDRVGWSYEKQSALDHLTVREMTERSDVRTPFRCSPVVWVGYTAGPRLTTAPSRRGRERRHTLETWPGKNHLRSHFGAKIISSTDRDGPTRPPGRSDKDARAIRSGAHVKQGKRVQRTGEFMWRNCSMRKKITKWTRQRASPPEKWW